MVDDEEIGPGDDDADADIDMSPTPEALVGDDIDDAETDDEEQDIIKAPTRTRTRRRTAARGPTIEGIPKAKLEKPEMAKEAWDKLASRFADAEIVDYTVTVTLTENDVVRHPKFGIGFVVEIPGARKAEILFDDGLRKLVFGR